MNELSLFAGVGGGILGGKLLDWRTVCAVEIDDYCRRILMQRQDDGILEPFPIWPDITTFDGKPWAGCVDIITGGFPCQDISFAGKGTGITGARSGLWKEMARVIGEIRPRYAFIENSPMLVSRGLERVLCGLAALGYDAEWGCLSACSLGAPHTRERLFIVAYSNRIDGHSRIRFYRKINRKIQFENFKSIQMDWMETTSENARGFDEVSHGVDRLKSIGNAQVPIVASTACKILMERLHA